MGKIHRLYFAFALLLLSFSCMQTAKCNPVVPFNPMSAESCLQSHTRIGQSGETFAWESEGQNIATLPLVTVVSYRTMNEKNGKLQLSSPGRLPYFRNLPSYKQETTHLHILSERREDGFYLYFLKKLRI